MNARIHLEIKDAPIGLPEDDHDDGRGASCRFRGTTRPEVHPRHGALLALDYEVHEAMAMTQLEMIAREIDEEHDLLALRVVHARGRVGVGEPSVLVEADSRHRDEAFQACRKMIDRLKERADLQARDLGGRHQPSRGVHPTPERRVD